MRMTQAFGRLLSRILRLFPSPVHYIGGSESLPPPLSREEERECIRLLAEGDEGVRRTLIERNLRLVVYVPCREREPFKSTAM